MWREEKKRKSAVSCRKFDSNELCIIILITIDTTEEGDGRDRRGGLRYRYLGAALSDQRLRCPKSSDISLYSMFTLRLFNNPKRKREKEKKKKCITQVEKARGQELYLMCVQPVRPHKWRHPAINFDAPYYLYIK